VLIKYVLSLLLVSFLFFFKSLTSIISFLEFLFKYFLLGWGSKEARKIQWIHWDKIRSIKEYGGLGIDRCQAWSKIIVLAIVVQDS